MVKIKVSSLESGKTLLSRDIPSPFPLVSKKDLVPYAVKGVSTERVKRLLVPSWDISLSSDISSPTLYRFCIDRKVISHHKEYLVRT